MLEKNCQKLIFINYNVYIKIYFAFLQSGTIFCSYLNVRLSYVRQKYLKNLGSILQ